MSLSFKRNSNFIEHSLLGALGFLKNSVFDEEYALKPGLLQALDPRIKMLTVLLFICAAVFTKDIFVISGLYALSLVLAYLSRIGPAFFLKRTLIFIPFFSFFFLLPAMFGVFCPGTTLARIHAGNLSVIITREGLYGALFVMARIATSVSLAILLSLTTRHARLLKVLRAFWVPQVFVMTLGMCYRYIYLFVEIIENMYMGIKSRVGSPLPAQKGRQLVTWRIASLWQRSYQLNNQVYAAMLSRGYRGEAFDLEDYRTKASDWIWLIFSLSVFAVLLYFRYRIK